MKTLFCLADVHGFYDEMMSTLDSNGFDINNNDHIIVHCGDLLDRGSKPLECLQFINSIPNNRKILIRGNHEDLLEELFHRGYWMMHDVHNGTDKTVCDIANMYGPFDREKIYAAIMKCSENKELQQYLDSVVDYAEIGDYIFVHGWIPTTHNNGIPIYKYEIDSWREGNWEKARWLNGMKKWSQGYTLENKTIVCGHYHTSWGHTFLHNFGVEWDDEYYIDSSDDVRAHFEPFIDKGIIALDQCVAYSGIMNCYKIEIEDDLWQ